MPDPRDASSPFIWPPVIYGSAAIISGVLSWFAPWPFEPSGARQLFVVLGVAILAGGIAVAVLAERLFVKAGTPVPPTRPTKAIVTTGIYRFTRNPMYLGMTLALLGLGLALDQVWFLYAIPAAMFAVTKLAIEREEAYLAKHFGAEYLSYKRQVRRWL